MGAASKCESPGCGYLAVSGEKFCLQHKPKTVILGASVDKDGFEFVEMKDVPSTGRYNEEAVKLIAAVKAAGVQKRALKVSTTKFKKGTLLTVQRMMLASGVRIGVRFQGEVGFLWYMTEQEIARAAQKGERLKAARSKIKKFKKEA